MLELDSVIQAYAYTWIRIVEVNEITITEVDEIRFFRAVSGYTTTDQKRNED